MAEYFDTVVIGAGQAGLAISYCLTQHGRNHIVLEKRAIGDSWRNGKWDSFTLVSPNWSLRLPGFAYQGDDPDGFLTRAQVIQYLEAYVQVFNPPVRTGVEVTCVEPTPHGFAIHTGNAVIESANVVIATGAFQRPKIPAFSDRIAPHIHQIHTSAYKNPQSLPPGGVLVVGSGQSGCQIAEELHQAGRKVHVATGRAIRIPRRYRGKDIFWWGQELGMFDKTQEKLQSPEERFAANPQLTGRNGGYAFNLPDFARKGIALYGHLEDADGSKVRFAADLADHLAMADGAEAQFKKAVDGYIDSLGADGAAQFPRDDAASESETDYAIQPVNELDLDQANITSIVWAGGYSFDYGWLRFPIFDERGFPNQQRGVTAQAGLYFMGLQYMHNTKSSLFLGMGEDAEYVVSHLINRG